MMRDERPRRLIPRGDLRQPTGWLNYPGRVDDPDPDRPMGPNLLLELLWPVMVKREDDRTRIGFSYIGPPPPSLRGESDANR